MAFTNFKLFDENKTNMMSDTEYNINTQRLNGVQAGIASSQLQNKTLYQTSLVAYSLAQIMMQNGYDANDSAAVSAFVGNMSNSLLQKVLDKATTAEAQNGVNNTKWMTPALTKASIDILAAKSQNILSDSTKTLYGLDSSAVPNDVLVLLSRFQDGLGNEYIWAKISEQIQNEYDEGTTTGLINFAGISGRTVTFVYGDTYSVNDDGIHTTINQPNEITVNTSSPASIFDGMKGKWWSYKDYSNANKFVCYMPESATVIRDMDSGYPNYKTNEPMTYRSNFHNVTTEKIIGYVNSPSPDTYPPTIDDGYIYEPLGQLGDKVRIATGSYTGTGTYGESNPNSLTFDFEPRFLYISGKSEWAIMNPLIRPTVTGGQAYPGTVFEYGNRAYQLNSLYSDTATQFKWINTSNATLQMNASGYTYHYIAID